MNEQFDKACEELDEEKAKKPQSNIELLQELAEINAEENA